MRKKRRLLPFLLGIALFLGCYLAPPMPDAVDPTGTTIALRIPEKTGYQSS